MRVLCAMLFNTPCIVEQTFSVGIEGSAVFVDEISEAAIIRSGMDGLRETDNQRYGQYLGSDP